MWLSIHTCCLPTPLTLASEGGGESDLPARGPPVSLSGLQVHHKSRGDDVCLVCACYTLCKGDLFVLGWARVRRVRWGNFFHS